MLKTYISSQNIVINIEELIGQRITELNKTKPDSTSDNYSEEVMSCVIVDSFNLDAESLKNISDKLVRMGLQIGRRHKNYLLKYLNYRKPEDIKMFFEELKRENPSFNRNELEQLINSFSPTTKKFAFNSFRNLWDVAYKEGDDNKLADYLFGLYTKLHAYYNPSKITNMELYNYNLPFIKNDLSSEGIKTLLNFCKNSSDSFYDEYISILHNELQEASLNGELEIVMNQQTNDSNFDSKNKIKDRIGDSHLLLTEEYDAVYFSINQQVLDYFDSYNDFLNYVLDTIKQAYRILINNKVFSVEIDNIYYNNRNIKWLLYAYIGVFSERFIKTTETRKYFAPEKICFEMLNTYGYFYNYNDEKVILECLKKYYHNNINNSEIIYSLLSTSNSENNFISFLEEWKNVYYGFTFNDCYIIKCSDDNHEQFSSYVKNDNKILFIFYKYRMDERKIPCPVCNGLNISGNSYSEIGHRSWECKNVICTSRSKSDRGKRYSFKTNYMQFGAQNLEADNIISKSLISKWRRDIASVSSDADIYYMFLKYFSFAEEKVLFINANQALLNEIDSCNREIVSFSLLGDQDFYSSIQPKIIIDNNLFNDFINGDYLKRFTIEKTVSNNNKKITLPKKNSSNYIFQGDAFEVLASLNSGCVSAAVTSPPYYNARKYSQWNNMYLYFIDMYNIIKNTLSVLDTSGIFIYNIGDINGNEATIAKSKMGEKRLLLGAYSILIFEKAGYELVENYIWDKGEPQSKRSTNDGNFTPHYQKPVNCYEHMFIFKRRGDTLNINSPLPEKWHTYISEFIPVYKINCHGENILGHTAPYPTDIPELAIALNGKPQKYILDPFLGSGTTIISAIQNGYSGIGIEYNEEYAYLSKKRILSEYPNCKITLQ